MARHAGAYRSEKFRKEQKRTKKRQEKQQRRHHQPKGAGPPIEAVELMPGMPGYGEAPAAETDREPVAEPAIISGPEE